VLTTREPAVPTPRGRSAACFAVLGAALVGFLSADCSKPPPARRVLLIGIDGASMRIIEPLLAEGQLPTLEAIARQGVHDILRSQAPIDSPPIWNTIVTGMVREKHGIPSFAYEDDSGAAHLFLSTDRKVPALWNIVSATGRSVGVVNFWNTYPPDRVNGVMVSDHVLAREVDDRAALTNAPAPAGGTAVYPAGWAKRIRKLLESGDPLTDTPNPFLDNAALPHWLLVQDLVRRYEEDTALARIALEIEREIRPDLLMVLLPGIDRVSHHLWGNLEPPEKYDRSLRPTDSERAAGKKALYDYYQHVDGLIGVLSANFGPNDLVMVVSDHGFEAGQPLMHLTGKHEGDEALDGVIFARGEGVGPPGGGIAGANISNVTPTILAWFDLPIAQDMNGRVMRFLRESRTPKTIASHQDTPVEKVTEAPSGAEREILEQLRAIGYLRE
jgi:predicted AlkP superfamily pyrophosphatase or phosphodiesterase